MYYSATLFSLVGFNKPTAVAIVVGATNFLFTFVNLVVIDKLGRRIILLVTVLGMVRYDQVVGKATILTFLRL